MMQHNISLSLLPSEVLCFFFMGDPISLQSFSLTSISYFKFCMCDTHAQIAFMSQEVRGYITLRHCKNLM